MTRIRVLSATVMAVWLSYTLSLWPLPSAEIKLYLGMMKESVEQPRALSTQPGAEAEQPELAALRAETQRKAQEFIDRADEHEATLWIQWGFRLGLIALGITGWLLFLAGRRFAIALIVTAALIYVLEKVLFSSIIYTELFYQWTHGSTGLKYVPWSFVVSTIYFYYAVPVFLVLSAALAFRWPVTRDVVS